MLALKRVTTTHVYMVSVATRRARSRALRMYLWVESVASLPTGAPPFCEENGGGAVRNAVYHCTLYGLSALLLTVYGRREKRCQLVFFRFEHCARAGQRGLVDSMTKTSDAV